jgi:hypothetical protein
MQQVYKRVTSPLEVRIFGDFETVATTINADVKLSALAVWLAACT